MDLLLSVVAENLLYTSSKRSDPFYSRVNIADFGIAKVTGTGAIGSDLGMNPSCRGSNAMMQTIAGTPAVRLLSNLLAALALSVHVCCV